MSDRRHADVFEILGCQLRQNCTRSAAKFSATSGSGSGSSHSLRSRPLIVLRSRRVAALVLDPAVDRAEHLLELDQHHALGELASAAASVAGKAHFAQFPRRELRYLRLASIRGEIATKGRAQCFGKSCSHYRCC